VFRDSTRSFSKCQLLTLPGIDAFSPESLRLLDTVKNAQTVPPPESEAGLAESRPFSDNKVAGRGRRLLAKEVAILHAPVYAAQVAAKKEQDMETRDRVKRRRQDDGKSDLEDVASNPQKRKRRIKWAPVGLESPLPDFSDFSQIHPSMTRTRPVQFLRPNTFLEQGTPHTWPSNHASPFESKSASERNATEQTGHNQEAPSTELFCPATALAGQHGTWTYLDTQHFERVGSSFALKGWMPDTKWYAWTSFMQAIEKRHSALDSTRSSIDGNDTTRYHHFMSKVRACIELETLWKHFFQESICRSAGPHNIWINLLGEPSTLAPVPSKLAWPEEGQLSKATYGTASIDLDETLPSSSDEEFERLDIPQANLAVVTSFNNRPAETTSFKAKRVPLTTRALMPLPIPQQVAVEQQGGPDGYPFDALDDLMAAFIAVRALLGGADKAIDWGLLMIIFPNTKLVQLRRFWSDARKPHGSYIANFTRAFQERIIAAFEKNEIPMIDFNHPQDYDWQRLIRWTLEIPRQEGFQLPASRESLKGRFSLESSKAPGEDWRERFFHTQTSIFSRFEAVTAVPAILAIETGTKSSENSVPLTKLDIARSWIKSLCSMGDGKYTVQEIRNKFVTLSSGDEQKTSALFREAIELLTKQKVICKSKKPPLGGRPYRLNEGYVAALSKMAQSSKYDDAAAFKTKLDASFRQEGKMRVPYSLTDGSMMALTNLNGSGRVKLVPTNLPNIPFGFEPGNYESRKYPKSYYHFGLEAVPTEHYLYNEQIDLLRVACERGPPLGDLARELPQWVDFFGKPNKQRWSEVLGAFCFSMATRGSMDIEGICSALNPILDEFEARLVVRWGKETGVLTDFADGVGLMVGEWWWLAVPWLRRV
jgi:transcription factor C subunit 3